MDLQKFQKKARKILKPWLHRLTKRTGLPKILLIFGCQRSGTTMLNEVFDRDWRSKTFGEDGGLARGWGLGARIRWRPYEAVRAIFEAEKASLLVAKPLVESQHAPAILQFFPRAKAIWVFRNYEDVIRSNLTKFGPEPIRYNLRAVVDPELKGHWFSENVSEHTRGLVEKYVAEDTSVEDLQALGWYARNALCFERELPEHPRVRLCRYEEMVSDPQREMERIYRFIDMDFPGPGIVRVVHSHSVRKGRGLPLSDEIRELCETMQARLNEAAAARF